jgi:hypothetical protein
VRPARDQALDDRHHLIGVTATAHPHGQGLPGVLVHDVQQLQPPVIGGLVELEVQSPHVVGALGAEELAALGPPTQQDGVVSRRGTLTDKAGESLATPRHRR